MLSHHPDAVKWNQIYKEEGERWLANRPRRLLRDFAHRLPASGLALDVAAGVATHGLFLARRGLHVVALDIAEVGLRLGQRRARAEGLKLETAVMDLSHLWLPPRCFDVILNFRFLERAAFPVFKRALKPGGWLVFETFVQGDTAVDHPHYYLQPGELSRAFADFDILHAEEISVTGSGGCPKRVARLVARKQSCSLTLKG